MTPDVGGGTGASPTGILRVDGLCDRFEAAWAGGARPKIEDFLGELKGDESDLALRELLPLELALRRADGDEPSPAEYHARFPERAAAIASAFPGLGDQDSTQIGTSPDGATDATFTDGPPATGAASKDRRLGPAPEGYELLEVLGRGGMGVVYRAIQVRLKRAVALKMVSAGGYASPDSLARFLAEAESIARLRHPNVVQIYDRGECEGLPFYSMEYFAAGSLGRRIDGTPWPAIAAARMVEQVSRGVAEAHRLGIIHRDLKPANILLADDGTPKVADFGLAKSMGSDSGLTRTDLIMGSPSYMAPEQAAGRTKAAGPGADIHALGAIFYEMLTGRTPFKGATELETLEQVRTAEPVAPSRLVPGMPRDAETIALKCLQKDPARRYATAQELADDLRRFAAGEIIVARRAGPLEHAWKWARRRPVMASLSAAVLLLAVVSTGAAIGIARIASREAQARSELRHTLYVTRMNLASQAWDDANIERLRELLVPYRAGSGDEDLRGFEWYLWWDRLHSPRIRRELPGNPGTVQSLAFSRDAATLATASEGGTAQVWDIARGTAGARFPIRTMGEVAVLAYHGSTLAAQAKDESLTLWDAETAAVRVRLRSENDGGWIRFLAFSPDGRSLFAYRDGPIQIEVWDVVNARLDRVLPRGSNWAYRLAISADYRTWAEGFLDGRIELLDLAAGSPIGTLDHPDHSPVRSLAFSPDGRTLAAGYQDQTIRIWDLPRRGGWPSVASGERLSVGRLLELLARPVERFTTLRGHRMPPFGLAFSPDGRTLASGSLDNTIMLWDAATGVCKETLKGHSGAIDCLGFSPDGSLLAAGGTEKSVKVWGVAGREREVLDAHPGGAEAVVFLPGGKVLASSGRENLIKLWDVETGRLIRTLSGHEDHVRGLAVVPLRTATLASSSRDGTVRLWDLDSGSVRATLKVDRPRSWTQVVACSPDGRLVASAGDGGRLTIWDVSTGQLRATIPGRGHVIRSIGFSPDGTFLLAGNWVDGIDLYDTANWQPRARLRDRDRPEILGPLAFSPDGSTLAVGMVNGSTTIWDAARWEPRAALRIHGGQVLGAAFSPDGRTVATASRDRSIKLWDAGTSELRTTLYGHTENVYAVAFTPDGTVLASASLDGTVRLWRAPLVP